MTTCSFTSCQYPGGIMIGSDLTALLPFSPSCLSFLSLLSLISYLFPLFFPLSSFHLSVFTLLACYPFSFLPFLFLSLTFHFPLLASNFSLFSFSLFIFFFYFSLFSHICSFFSHTAPLPTPILLSCYLNLFTSTYLSHTFSSTSLSLYYYELSREKILDPADSRLSSNYFLSIL